MPNTIKIIKKSMIILFIVTIILFTGLISIKWVGKIVYPLKYREFIEIYSEEYDIDPLLVASIIKVESGYYKTAQSHKGAKGLMQITPSTGEWIAGQMGIVNFNSDQLYDPKTNIMMGCWYLHNLKKQFENIELILAAYNGGRGNVVKWLKNTSYSLDGENLYDIPFNETKKYVEKVENSYKIYNFLYDKDNFQ